MNFKLIYAQKVAEVLADHPSALILGQNVNVGSHISGLSSFLRERPLSKKTIVLNTPNIETSLVGFSMGCVQALGLEYSACLFIKQMDFLTLMTDDLIHTVNGFKAMGLNPSLNIITFVVDSGFEGPQSRFYSPALFGELTGASFYFLNSRAALRAIEKMPQPGLKIFYVSQRYFNDPVSAQRQAGEDERASKEYDGVLFFVGFSAMEFVREGRLPGVSLPHNYKIETISEHPYKASDDVKKILQRSRRAVLVDDSRDEGALAKHVLQNISSQIGDFEYKILFDQKRHEYLGINDDRVFFGGELCGRMN